jgi:hypothetical protein
MKARDKMEWGTELASATTFKKTGYIEIRVGR